MNRNGAGFHDKGCHVWNTCLASPRGLCGGKVCKMNIRNAQAPPAGKGGRAPRPHLETAVFDGSEATGRGQLGIYKICMLPRGGFAASTSAAMGSVRAVLGGGLVRDARCRGGGSATHQEAAPCPATVAAVCARPGAGQRSCRRFISVPLLLWRLVVDWWTLCRPQSTRHLTASRFFIHSVFNLLWQFICCGMKTMKRRKHTQTMDNV